MAKVLGPLSSLPGQEPWRQIVDIDAYYEECEPNEVVRDDHTMFVVDFKIKSVDMAEDLAKKKLKLKLKTRGLTRFKSPKDLLCSQEEKDSSLGSKYVRLDWPDNGVWRCLVPCGPTQKDEFEFQLCQDAFFGSPRVIGSCCIDLQKDLPRVKMGQTSATTVDKVTELMDGASLIGALEMSVSMKPISMQTAELYSRYESIRSSSLAPVCWW